MGADGVPKEGLSIQDVLVRTAVLLLIRDKVSSISCSEMPQISVLEYLVFCFSRNIVTCSIFQYLNSCLWRWKLTFITFLLEPEYACYWVGGMCSHVCSLNRTFEWIKYFIPLRPEFIRLSVFSQVRASLVVSSTLFADDIISRYPALKSLRFWKEDHDKVLLQAVLKYVPFLFLLLLFVI